MAASRRALTTGATVRNVYTGLSGSMGWLAHTLVQSGFTGEPDGVASVYGGDLRRSLRPRGGGARARRGVPAAARVHQGPRVRALHPRRARLRGGPDGPAPARRRSRSRPSACGPTPWRPASATPTSARSSALGSRCPSRWPRSCATADRASTTTTRPPWPILGSEALARRVEVVEDPDFTRAFPGRQPTEVTVELADGTGCRSTRTFTGARPSSRIRLMPCGESSWSWPRRSGGRAGGGALRPRARSRARPRRGGPGRRTRGYSPLARLGPGSRCDLQIANPRHHVAADALEGAQHELVVAHDMADHHVVEPHVPVSAEILDDGVRAAHE